MADELTPGQVRARQFDVVRKGFERGQVERYLADLAGHIEQLQAELAELSTSDVALGIDEQEALARELHTIGGDVADILEAARAAAEGIRSRANADAETWRTTAEAESSSMVAEALEQTQSVRASAWNEGSSLLSSASAEADSIVAAAKEEALFVRAEAEREAIRLTGDAKRDREEIVRVARAEAEQIIEAARVDSEGVMAAANQQAELAEERARALEDRRTELLAELEATRASIGELENEIESRRLALEEPSEPEPVEDEVDEPTDARSHHTPDGGSVKIVAPTRVAPLRPVDAEELVAEVTALRAGEVADLPADPPTSPPSPAHEVAQPVGADATPDTAVVSDPFEAPPVIEDADTAVADDDDTREVVLGAEPDAPTPPSTEAAEPVDDEESTPAPTAEPEVLADERESLDDATVDEPSPAVQPDRVDDEADHDAGSRNQDDSGSSEPTAEQAGADDLGSLFAQLRDTTIDDGGAVSSGEAVATVEPVTPEESGASDEGSADDGPPDADQDADPEPRTDAESDDSSAGSDQGEASADRAAQLISVQNAALRSIKRTLVDLQNEALEHLRTDKEWMPDEAFTDRFDGAFEELTLVATGEVDNQVSSAFGTDLYDAVSSAMERSRESGAGERELAAATSKVFRTWRSDEAERRVAQVAQPSLAES